MTSRREFLRSIGAAALSVQGLPLARARALPAPSAFRPDPPVVRDEIRFGLIGAGLRGRPLMGLLMNVRGASIRAVCDVLPDRVDRAVEECRRKGHEPRGYTGADHAYRDMLAQDDLDAVLIATPWEWHVPMALDTMNAGRIALLEVPAATTIDGCWALVETSERTGQPLMMLENCCYGRQELMVLNMARLGLFGELTHAQGAYIHDMRSKIRHLTPDDGNGFWRVDHWLARDGNHYPTHGLGPIAQYMDINRGDRFDYLVSMSSLPAGRSHYARRHLPPEHPRATGVFAAGDVNSSLIRTVRGRTILVQYEGCTPRPYSRINQLQGTRGCFMGDPPRMSIEGITEGERWASPADFQDRFDHPLIRRMGEESGRQGGHGGMDFLMLWRLVYCLRHGLPLDQDVYDAASWSVVTHLSAMSVAERSRPVDFPDFTRGRWKNRPSFNIDA